MDALLARFSSASASIQRASVFALIDLLLKKQKQKQQQQQQQHHDSNTSSSLKSAAGGTSSRARRRRSRRSGGTGGADGPSTLSSDSETHTSSQHSRVGSKSAQDQDWLEAYSALTQGACGSLHTSLTAAHFGASDTATPTAGPGAARGGRARHDASTRVLSTTRRSLSSACLAGLELLVTSGALSARQVISDVLGALEVAQAGLPGGGEHAYHLYPFSSDALVVCLVRCLAVEMLKTSEDRAKQAQRDRRRGGGVQQHLHVRLAGVDVLPFYADKGQIHPLLRLARLVPQLGAVIAQTLATLVFGGSLEALLPPSFWAHHARLKALDVPQWPLELTAGFILPCVSDHEGVELTLTLLGVLTKPKFLASVPGLPAFVAALLPVLSPSAHSLGLTGCNMAYEAIFDWMDAAPRDQHVQSTWQLTAAALLSTLLEQLESSRPISPLLPHLARLDACYQRITDSVDDRLVFISSVLLLRLLTRGADDASTSLVAHMLLSYVAKLRESPPNAAMLCAVSAMHYPASLLATSGSETPAALGRQLLSALDRVRQPLFAASAHDSDTRLTLQPDQCGADLNAVVLLYDNLKHLFANDPAAVKRGVEHLVDGWLDVVDPDIASSQLRRQLKTSLGGVAPPDLVVSLATLLYHPSLDAVAVLFDGRLQRLTAVAPLDAVDLLPLMLQRLTSLRESPAAWQSADAPTAAAVQLSVLRTIPCFSKHHRDCIPSVLGTVMSLLREPGLQGVALQLVCDIWSDHSGIFSHLERLLTQPLQAGTESLELRLAKLSCARRVCDELPKQGLELIALVQQGLADAEEVVAGQALGALSALCSHGILDFYKAHAIVTTTIAHDLSPVRFASASGVEPARLLPRLELARTLVEFLAFGAQDADTEANSSVASALVQDLWAYADSFDPQLRATAFAALLTFATASSKQRADDDEDDGKPRIADLLTSDEHKKRIVALMQTESGDVKCPESWSLHAAREEQQGDGITLPPALEQLRRLAAEVLAQEKAALLVRPEPFHSSTMAKAASTSSTQQHDQLRRLSTVLFAELSSVRELLDSNYKRALRPSLTPALAGAGLLSYTGPTQVEQVDVRALATAYWDRLSSALVDADVAIEEIGSAAHWSRSGWTVPAWLDFMRRAVPVWLEATVMEREGGAVDDDEASRRALDHVMETASGILGSVDASVPRMLANVTLARAGLAAALPRRSYARNAAEAVFRALLRDVESGARVSEPVACASLVGVAVASFGLHATDHALIQSAVSALETQLRDETSSESIRAAAALALGMTAAHLPLKSDSVSCATHVLRLLLATADTAVGLDSVLAQAAGASDALPAGVQLADALSSGAAVPQLQLAIASILGVVQVAHVLSDVCSTSSDAQHLLRNLHHVLDGLASQCLASPSACSPLDAALVALDCVCVVALVQSKVEPPSLGAALLSGLSSVLAHANPAAWACQLLGELVSGLFAVPPSPASESIAYLYEPAYLQQLTERMSGLVCGVDAASPTGQLDASTEPIRCAALMAIAAMFTGTGISTRGIMTGSRRNAVLLAKAGFYQEAAVAALSVVRGAFMGTLAEIVQQQHVAAQHATPLLTSLSAWTLGAMASVGAGDMSRFAGSRLEVGKSPASSLFRQLNEQLWQADAGAGSFTAAGLSALHSLADLVYADGWTLNHMFEQLEDDPSGQVHVLRFALARARRVEERDEALSRMFSQLLAVPAHFRKLPLVVQRELFGALDAVAVALSATTVLDVFATLVPSLLLALSSPDSPHDALFELVLHALRGAGAVLRSTRVHERVRKMVTAEILRNVVHLLPPPELPSSGQDVPKANQLLAAVAEHVVRYAPGNGSLDDRIDSLVPTAKGSAPVQSSGSLFAALDQSTHEQTGGSSASPLAQWSTFEGQARACFLRCHLYRRGLLHSSKSVLSASRNFAIGTQAEAPQVYPVLFALVAALSSAHRLTRYECLHWISDTCDLALVSKRNPELSLTLLAALVHVWSGKPTAWLRTVEDDIDYSLARALSAGLAAVMREWTHAEHTRQATASVAVDSTFPQQLAQLCVKFLRVATKLDSFSITRESMPVAMSRHGSGSGGAHDGGGGEGLVSLATSLHVHSQSLRRALLSGLQDGERDDVWRQVWQSLL